MINSPSVDSSATQSVHSYFDTSKAVSWRAPKGIWRSSIPFRISKSGAKNCETWVKEPLVHSTKWNPSCQLDECADTRARASPMSWTPLTGKGGRAKQLPSATDGNAIGSSYTTNPSPAKSGERFAKTIDAIPAAKSTPMLVRLMVAIESPVHSVPAPVKHPAMHPFSRTLPASVLDACAAGCCLGRNRCSLL